MARSRLIAALAAIAMVAAACGGAITTPETTTTTLSRPATTSPASPSTSESLAGSETIRAQIDELIIEAQQIRGLEFFEPVDVVLLNDADYQARLNQIFAEDLAEEDVDAANAALRLLGVIEPDQDFRQMVETLYSAGTAGFYRPKTGELVVRVIGDELGPYSKSTVLHELFHALQDQHFDLLDRLEDLDGDDAYVAQAIIEGDSRLREFTYVQSLSTGDRAKYMAEIGTLIAELDTTALEALPGYILDSFQSLYDDGLAFHQSIGLDAVDDQFIDPPESSEQLLDPEKYRRDEQPREVVLPELELPGYEIWFDATAGQKDLELLLAEAIDPDKAEEASAGWGGDANRIYNAGDRDAVYVLSYLGDSKRDAEELEEAFAVFIDKMVADQAYTLLTRDADHVLLIIASDPSLGPELAAAFS